MILIENKGLRLAEKLGTKLYNEGEKSTRYFLRITQRAEPDDFRELTDDAGNIILDQKGIEEEIVKLY